MYLIMHLATGMDYLIFYVCEVYFGSGFIIIGVMYFEFIVNILVVFEGVWFRVWGLGFICEQHILDLRVQLSRVFVFNIDI